MAGKAKEEQSSRAGTYILANGLVNGYPHWLLKTDGSQAIWFDKVGSSWLVSEKENLGTNNGGIAGLYGKDSYPHEIKQGWRFTIVPGEPWADATPSEIIFKAIGIYSFQTFTSQNQFNFFTSQSSIQPFQKLLIKLEFFK